MPTSRRRFLARAAAASALSIAAPAVLAAPSAASDAAFPADVIKPPRLQPGQTVGLVAPAGAIYEPDDVVVVEEIVRALGLVPRRGAHLLDRRGYLAGTDEARAADLNDFFADPDVDALLPLRGGWGVARLLPLLDYDVIRAHPKVLVGYSDITALLLAIYARAGVVTFHGPVGISSWNPFSVDHFRRVLFDAEAVRLANPAERGRGLTVTDDRVLTIRPGRARGRLAGGNLTVLTALVGTGYLPDWRGHILFLEDVGEDVYRIDRMLTQLRLAGVLDGLAGFVFGKCSSCSAGGGYGSLTLSEVFNDHVCPLGIPAWQGAMIGHISDKFTVPVGVEAEIDAARGTITLLEPAVA